MFIVTLQRHRQMCNFYLYNSFHPYQAQSPLCKDTQRHQAYQRKNDHNLSVRICLKKKMFYFKFWKPVDIFLLIQTYLKTLYQSFNIALLLVVQRTWDFFLQIFVIHLHAPRLLCCKGIGPDDRTTAFVQTQNFALLELGQADDILERNFNTEALSFHTSINYQYYASSETL